MKRTLLGLALLTTSLAVTSAQDTPTRKPGEPPPANTAERSVKSSAELALGQDIANTKAQIAFQQKRLEYWKVKKEPGSDTILSQWEGQLQGERSNLADLERRLKILVMDRAFAEQFPDLIPKAPSRGGFGDRGGFGGMAKVDRGGFERPAPAAADQRTIEEKLNEILRRLDASRGLQPRPQDQPVRRTPDDRLDEVLRRLDSLEQQLDRMERQRPLSKKGKARD